MADVQHKRGTRAALNALAAANSLLPGQLYVITDESRIAVADTVSTYTAYAKESEAGSVDVGDTTLAYNGDGTLNTVTDNTGTRTLGYTSGVLTTIVGPGGTTTLTYTDGRLTGVDRP